MCGVRCCSSAAWLQLLIIQLSKGRGGIAAETEPNYSPLISFTQQNLTPHFREPLKAVERLKAAEGKGGLRPPVPPLLTAMELWPMTFSRYFLIPEAEVIRARWFRLI